MPSNFIIMLNELHFLVNIPNKHRFCPQNTGYIISCDYTCFKAAFCGGRLHKIVYGDTPGGKANKRSEEKVDPTTGASHRAVTRREGVWPKSFATAAPSCATAGVKGRVTPLSTGRRLGGRSCKQLEDLGPRSAKGCLQHSLKSRLLFSTSTSCFFFFMALVFMWGAGRTLPAALLLPVVQFRPLELWHATAPSL